MMKFTRKRLAIACLPVIALQWPAIAGAQAAPEAQDGAPFPLPEVVVIGEAARNRTDIELKREHSGVYDSMSSDDIGSMPDISIADAFRRLPGVTGIVDAFSSDFDTGVTNHLTVRGLSGSYNLVAFDDLVLATAESVTYGTAGSSTPRDVGLGNFPTTSVKRIEVISSFSADINGEATGGYINIVSGSAYDTKNPSLFLINGDIGHNGPNNVPDFNNPEGSRRGIGGNLNFTASERFGRDERFGIVATGVYNERRWDTETFLRDGNSLVTYNGQSVADPTQIRPNTYSNYQDQYGGTLKLEFKPSSNFYGYLYGLYYRKDQHTVRNGDTLVGATGFTNTDANDGAWAKAYGLIFYIDEPFQYSNSLVGWHTEWEPADRHKITVNAGWSTATQNEQATQINYESGGTTTPTPNLAGTFVQGPDSFSYALANPTYFLAPANYKNTAYYTTNTDQTGDTKIIKLDYAFNQGRHDYGFGYKTGLNYIDMARKYDQNEIDYSATGAGQLFGSAVTLIENPRHLAGGNYGMLYIDPNAVIGSRGWTVTSTASPAADWNFEEYDAAAYGMATWKSETLQANAGLRYENTVQTSLNYDQTTFAPYFHRGRYDAWLPSATLLYDLTDGLRLRASASKTIGRPTPGEVAMPGAVKTTDPNGDATITGGNADLRPRRVNNYDIGAEYYWNKGNSLASVTLFDKDIKDDIFITSVPVTIADMTYTYNTPHNADGSGIRGVVAEIIENHFDFLPDFLQNLGGLLNGTFTDAYTMWHSGATAMRFGNMVGQSKWAGNATLFYQFRDLFQARISYNYRSKYDYAFSTNGSYVDSYGQLDLGLRYNLSDNIVLRADARNLTDARYLRFYTNVPRLYQSTDYGQSFTLGVSYKID